MRKFLFLDGRRGQGIKGITRKINKPKMTLKTFYIPFPFKPIECMDTIRVAQSLNYKSMMEVLCFKSSPFCVNEPSLCSHNIVGILTKLIFFGGGIFLNNHNNVAFACVFCTRDMMINNKVLDLGLIYIPLCLRSHVFIFTIF